nr:MAG: hypothetical protein [Lokiarchaeota virus Ratatoskr Meg22_1012]
MLMEIDSFIHLGILVLFGIGGGVVAYAISFFGKYIGEPEEDELTRRKKSIGVGISTFISLCVYWYFTPGLLMFSWSNILFMLMILGTNTGAVEVLSKLYDWLDIGKDDEKKLEKLKKSREKFEKIVSVNTKRIKAIDEERSKLEASIAMHEKELEKLMSGNMLQEE